MINLKPYYIPKGPESCGFVLLDGSVIEVPNVASNPKENFQVSEEDLQTYESQAVATWHTHPSSSCNLSAPDYLCFLAFPNLQHYIYDGDRLARYSISGMNVILEEVLNQ